VDARRPSAAAHEVEEGLDCAHSWALRFYGQSGGSTIPAIEGSQL